MTRKDWQKAKKKQFQEEQLDSKNSFGMSDPVPMAAVSNLMRKEKKDD